MSGSPFGILETKASEKASDQQYAAAKLAADTQLAMYQQGRADLAPIREAGAGAINALWGTPGTPGTPAQTTQGAPIYGTSGGTPGVATGSFWGMEMQYDWESNSMKPVPVHYIAGDSVAGLMGGGQQQITGYQPSTTTPATPATPGTKGLIQAGPGPFKESEGYQWTLGQGLQAQQRQASATGRLGSGAYIKDATKYAEGLASTEYDNFLNRYYKSLDPYFRMAGYGSNVAMSGADNAGQTGNALANSIMAGGAAQAAGTLGQYNSLANNMGNVGNQIGNWMVQNKPWAQTAGGGNSLGSYSTTPYPVGAGAGMGYSGADMNSMIWL